MEEAPATRLGFEVVPARGTSFGSETLLLKTLFQDGLPLLFLGAAPPVRRCGLGDELALDGELEDGLAELGEGGGGVAEAVEVIAETAGGCGELGGQAGRDQTVERRPH